MLETYNTVSTPYRAKIELLSKRFKTPDSEEGRQANVSIMNEIAEVMVNFYTDVHAFGCVTDCTVMPYFLNESLKNVAMDDMERKKYVIQILHLTCIKLAEAGGKERKRNVIETAVQGKINETRRSVDVDKNK